MKKSFGEYRRLAGGGRSRGSLWEGPDHLLYIQSQGFGLSFSESYRRIDYAKIQAFEYGATRTWPWTLAWQAVLTALCTTGAGFWIVSLSDPGALAFFGPVSAVILLILVPSLINNIIKGPSCICKVQTGVQVLRLMPVNRMREAGKVAVRIRELCLAHQGSLTPQPLGMGPAAVPLETSMATGLPMETKTPFAGSSLITWGLILLMISGGLMMAEMVVDNLAYLATDALFFIAAAPMLVVALFRHKKVQLPPALKGALWGAGINWMVTFLFAMGLYFYASMQVTGDLVREHKFGISSDEVQSRLVQWLSQAGFEQLGWVAWVIVGLGALNIFFGLLGLPSALRPPAAAVSPVPPVMPPAMPSAIPPPPTTEAP